MKNKLIQIAHLRRLIANILGNCYEYVYINKNSAFGHSEWKNTIMSTYRIYNSRYNK